MVGRLLCMLAMAGAMVVAASYGTSAERIETGALQASRHGPFGPFGSRMCEQLWIMPSGDGDIDLRATVFRPGASDGVAGCADITPRPVVIVNHGTDPNTRRAVSMPVFYWLSHWFVDRGFIVVVPQRRGFGATGGAFAEGRDTCRHPEHYDAAQTIADDIEAVARFVAAEPMAHGQPVIAAGVSSGGWGTLALGGRKVPGLRAVINFAGGRGAYAWGRPGEICDADSLADASGRLGRESRVPSLWLYARNDSYFPPKVSTDLFQAYRAGGGEGEFMLLPPIGREGHAIVDDEAAWSAWGKRLDGFLAAILPHHDRAHESRPAQASLR